MDKYIKWNTWVERRDLTWERSGLIAAHRSLVVAGMLESSDTGFTVRAVETFTTLGYLLDPGKQVETLKYKYFRVVINPNISFKSKNLKRANYFMLLLSLSQVTCLIKVKRSQLRWSRSLMMPPGQNVPLGDVLRHKWETLTQLEGLYFQCGLGMFQDPWGGAREHCWRKEFLEFPT